MKNLQERIDNGEVIILDGAMGTELEDRGVPIAKGAWSAAAILSHPNEIRKLHEDDIAAGADVIITDTYACSRPVMENTGMGKEVAQVNKRAAELATEARINAGGIDRVAIAGSISSSNSSLLSPYWENKATLPTEQQARAGYLEQAEILASGGVDLIVLEMMGDLHQTIYALEASLSTGLPVWVGFSTRISSNGAEVLLRESADDGPTLIRGLDEVLSRGCSLVAIMHSLTSDIEPSLKELQKTWNGPMGAYPNSTRFQGAAGIQLAPSSVNEEVISHSGFVSTANQWVNAGAQIIGGCCGIGLEHIRMLKGNLPSHIPGR